MPFAAALACVPVPARSQSALAAAVQPTAWMPAHGRECARSGKRKGFCQGPRRVPLPHGEDAERAERLGLGTLSAAGVLLGKAPRPEWAQAAGADGADALLW